MVRQKNCHLIHYGGAATLGIVLRVTRPNLRQTEQLMHNSLSSEGTMTDDVARGFRRVRWAGQSRAARSRDSAIHVACDLRGQSCDVGRSSQAGVDSKSSEGTHRHVSAGELRLRQDRLVQSTAQVMVLQPRSPPSSPAPSAHRVGCILRCGRAKMRSIARNRTAIRMAEETSEIHQGARCSTSPPRRWRALGSHVTIRS